MKFELVLNEETLAQLAGVSSEDVLIKNPTVLPHEGIRLEIFAKEPSGKILMDKLGLKLEVEETNKQQLITESYKRALILINDAIKNMEAIQDNTDYSKLEYRDALESQLTLEKAKLELINKDSILRFSSN